MRRLLIYLLIPAFILLVLLPGRGQNTPAEGNDQIKGLTKKLAGHKDDTAKVQLLTDIAYEYNRISPYDGIRYANIAIDLAKKIHWKLGIARGNSCLGANYFSLSDFPMAYKYWLISLNINIEIDNKTGIANHYHNIGNVFYSQKNYTTALEYYEKALKSSVLIGNNKIITHSYTAIGNVYTQQKKYEQALDYYFQALSLDKKDNLKGNIASDYINLGNVYNEQAQYQKALTVLLDGKTLKQQTGDKNGLANAYGLTGRVLLNLAKTTAASAAGSQPGYDTALLHSAVRYMDSAIAIANESRFLDNLQKNYKSLSEAYDLLKNYQAAFTSYTRYSGVKDSVYSLEKQTDIFNMQKKAELEEQNRELAKEAEEEQQRKYLQIGGICMFITLLITLLLFIRNKKVKPQLIDMLCTFSVLTIFEFINLLIHGKIEHITHHNLVLMLFFLLLLAAIIIPLHHKIEHWLKKKIAHSDLSVKKH